MARRAPLRVEDAVLLEDLRNDGNGGVDGVRDDQDERLRCCGRDTGSKITNDTGVDLVIVSQWTFAHVRHAHLEQVVPTSYVCSVSS